MVEVYKIKQKFFKKIGLVFVIYKGGRQVHRTHYWQTEEDAQWFIDNLIKTGVYDYGAPVWRGPQRNNQ